MIIYCPCAATSTGYEDLTNVTIANLNNSSIAVGSMYTDFTSEPPAILAPGQTYNISISTGGGSYLSSEEFAVINNATYPTAQQGNKLVESGNVGAAQHGFSVALNADGNTDGKNVIKGNVKCHAQLNLLNVTLLEIKMIFTCVLLATICNCIARPCKEHNGILG